MALSAPFALTFTIVAKRCPRLVASRHLVRNAWSWASPGLSFAVIRCAKREQPRGIVLARLICVRCKKDVKSVLRCRSCGALCPTSRIGSALLSPGALAFYGLILVVVAILWFA